ncbi:MAG: tetratricopeptide repeat protein [Gammaproteobacteria bacterium]
MAGSIFEELKRRRVIRVAAIYLIASWVIAQVADVMFPALNLPRWTITLVAALLVLGFPIVMVLAWAFDVRPGGVVRTEEVPGVGRRGQTRAMIGFGLLLAAGTAVVFLLLNPGRSFLLNLAIAVGILLVASTALLFFLLYPRRGSGPAETDPSEVAGKIAPGAAPAGRSIVVLPFLNVSASPDNEYFGDGIAEELINVLTRIDGLKVAARTSSRHYKGRNEKVQTIAAELGVDTVLEGSVRRVENRVRVTATLVNASDGYHLWSESYDRELDDILAVQDDIARSIARALQVTIRTDGESSSAPTSNPDAYQAYLRASYLWKRRETGAIRLAIQGFEETVRLDGGFARAYANLGAAYHKLPLYDADADAAESQRRAEAAARRALELDPGLAEAHATLGSILADRHEFVEAEAIFRRAVDTDPKDPAGHHWYANFLLTSGRSTRALEEVRRAGALDPLNAAVEGTLGSICFALGNNAEALDHYRNAERLGWGTAAQALRGAVYLHSGDRAQAEPCLRAGRLSNESIPSAIVEALVRETRPAERILASLRRDEISAAAAFRLCSMCGAEEIFDLGVDLHGVPSEAMMPLWYPPAAPIRRHRRFAALSGALGLPALWRAHGWPDACRPDGDGFVCS